MKDALGHGSNPHGTHASAVDKVGKVPMGITWGKNKTTNLEQAQRIAKALGHNTTVYSNPKNTGPAYYFQGGIHFNAAHKYWRDPVGTMQKASNLSSSSPEHVIHHEIGHAIYDAPDNFMNVHHEQTIARTHVSKYAAMNPKEFVSEVHAGTKAGKEYPAEVMQIFNRYARPRKG
jgi:hypothetical protein